MLQAERKCRKLRMGYIPYSPQLAQLLNTINFWQLVIRKVKGHSISGPIIQIRVAQSHVRDNSFEVLSVSAVSDTSLVFHQNTEPNWSHGL